MEIALNQIVEAARRRRAAVTAEVAGYLLLLVTRSVANNPQRVVTEGIVLSADGEVGVVAGPRASVEACERELRALLASLLGLSQSAPPALKAAAGRASTGNLPAFVAELLAALIPINHAAAGRALARLYRETSRAESALGDLASRPPEPPLPSDTPAPASSHGAAGLPSMASLVAAAPVLVSPPVAPLSAPVDASASSAGPEGGTTGLAEATDLELADLEIEVEFVGDDIQESIEPNEVDLLLDEKFEATPGSGIPPHSMVRLASPGGPPEEETAPVSRVIEYSEPVRSDVRELIEGFLAHTRSDERMAADLRKMIGLDAGREQANPVPVALGR
jgi:hypothetical protein